MAEMDLKNRGAGNIYGLEQHGLVDLKIASMSDFAQIEATRDAALSFMADYKIKDYPALLKRIENKNFRGVSRD